MRSFINKGVVRSIIHIVKTSMFPQKPQTTNSHVLSISVMVTINRLGTMMLTPLYLVYDAAAACFE